MENRITGTLTNTFFYLKTCENQTCMIVEYIGYQLDFRISQWIKYYLFQWEPFLKRRYDLIFDLESYCDVPDDGWRLLLLLRRWLNYSDHDVFLSNPNSDIKNWKKKFGMQNFFQIKKINANGYAK